MLSAIGFLRVRMLQQRLIRSKSFKVLSYPVSNGFCFPCFHTELSRDIDFQNMVVLAGNDKYLHSRAAVEDLTR